jgi:hypothetical protein
MDLLCLGDSGHLRKPPFSASSDFLGDTHGSVESELQIDRRFCIGFGKEAI